VAFTADGKPNRTFDTSGWSAGITDANAELIKINENGSIPLYAFVPAKDVILMSVDAPSGPNEIRYKVGFNVSPYDGSTSSWQ
jgi:hypothetical protein